MFQAVFLNPNPHAMQNQTSVGTSTSSEQNETKSVYFSSEVLPKEISEEKYLRPAVFDDVVLYKMNMKQGYVRNKATLFISLPLSFYNILFPMVKYTDKRNIFSINSFSFILRLILIAIFENKEVFYDRLTTKNNEIFQTENQKISQKMRTSHQLLICLLAFESLYFGVISSSFYESSTTYDFYTNILIRLFIYLFLMLLGNILKDDILSSNHYNEEMEINKLFVIKLMNFSGQIKFPGLVNERRFKFLTLNNLLLSRDILKPYSIKFSVNNYYLTNSLHNQLKYNFQPSFFMSLLAKHIEACVRTDRFDIFYNDEKIHISPFINSDVNKVDFMPEKFQRCLNQLVLELNVFYVLSKKLILQDKNLELVDEGLLFSFRGYQNGDRPHIFAELLEAGLFLEEEKGILLNLPGNDIDEMNKSFKIFLRKLGDLQNAKTSASLVLGVSSGEERASLNSNSVSAKSNNIITHITTPNVSYSKNKGKIDNLLSLVYKTERRIFSNFIINFGKYGKFDESKRPDSIHDIRRIEAHSSKEFHCFFKLNCDDLPDHIGNYIKRNDVIKVAQRSYMCNGVLHAYTKEIIRISGNTPVYAKLKIGRDKTELCATKFVTVEYAGTTCLMYIFDTLAKHSTFGHAK